MNKETAQPPIKHPEKGTRAAQLVAMLGRKQGATLGDIVKATAWRTHTARAALTGIRKRGFVITSDKQDGKDRIYRIAETD